MYFNNENNHTNLDSEFTTKKKFNPKFLIIGIIVLIVIIGLCLLIPKLLHKEYYLVLKGDTDIIIKQNEFYEEAGFKATDNKGNDLSDQVEIIGEVNTAVVGEYKITYSFNNITKERTVLVVADEKQVTYLILNGDTTMFMKVGEKYTEPGYTVIDNLESNLTDKVKVSGNVNTNTAGAYKLVYSVTNKSGEMIREERTVIVMDSNINLSYTPTSPTNGTVTIKVSVIDNYFNYLLLPDNTKSTLRTVTYNVTQNGTYKFVVHSKDGSFKEQEVVVNNIDQEAPRGSCSGYYKKGNSYITVNAQDNSEIAKYVINNQEFNNKQITYNQELTTVTVNIYDKANNQTSIKCSLKNENTIYPAFFGVKGYTYDTGDIRSYWLYVPENARDNMPMIVYLHGKGEMGNDYDTGESLAINWGPGRDIKRQNAKFKDVIILMPQTLTSYWAETNRRNIKNIIDKIANDYNVDKQRISLVGFSDGCSILPIFLKEYPNYFSAAVPIECQSHSNMEYAKLYVNTPTWTFASQTGTNNELSILVRNINKAGGTAQHSYYPDLGHTGLVGHSNYSIFMDEKLGLINWLTSQRKKSN